MKRTKKMLALALTASMVMGNAMLVFAETAPTSGNTSGTGTSEGHVVQKVTNVILPTDPTDGTSLFAYKMDPERLIQGTGAAKYEEGSTFPKADEDSGVYFLVGDKTYANTSNAYQVINKSSCDVVVTVDVEATATAGGKDIPLVAESAIQPATNAGLYLGLSVGGGTPIAVTNTKQSVKKVITGAPTNFQIGVKTGENNEKVYEYQTKPDASTWKAMNISLTGKVTKDKDIEADTTAPTVKVTWSWAEKTDADSSLDTATMVDFVEGPQMTVSTAGLINMTGLTATQNYKSVIIEEADGTKNNVTVAPVTYAADNWSEENGGTLGIQLSGQWMDYLKGKTVTFTLTLTDDSTKTAEVTFPAPEA